MTDSKIPKIIKKYYRINLEIIIKETDFPTKKCRSAKKITQLRGRLHEPSCPGLPS